MTTAVAKKETRQQPMRPWLKGRTFHRVERRSGSFSRTVTLPCPVKEDAIAAQYRDGVLTVQLPKTTEAKSRRIQVAT